MTRLSSVARRQARDIWPDDPEFFFTRRIYFIRFGPDGPIKIGTAVDSRGRLKTLQTGSPVQLRFLGEIEGDPRDEQQLHRRFGHLRVRGEWFRPEPELLAFIEEALAHPGPGAASLRAGAGHTN